jgi:hypothetical protein
LVHVQKPKHTENYCRFHKTNKKTNKTDCVFSVGTEKFIFPIRGHHRQDAICHCHIRKTKQGKAGIAYACVFAEDWSSLAKASLKLLTLHVQLRDHVSVQENLARVFHTYGHGAAKEPF